MTDCSLLCRYRCYGRERRDTGFGLLPGELSGYRVITHVLDIARTVVHDLDAIADNA